MQHGTHYFMDAGIILTLITLGKYLEVRSKGEAGAAIERLLDLAPKTARVVRDGRRGRGAAGRGPPRRPACGSGPARRSRSMAW